MNKYIKPIIVFFITNLFLSHLVFAQNKFFNFDDFEVLKDKDLLDLMMKSYNIKQDPNFYYTDSDFSKKFVVWFLRKVEKNNNSTTPIDEFDYGVSCPQGSDPVRCRFLVQRVLSAQNLIQNKYTPKELKGYLEEKNKSHLNSFQSTLLSFFNLNEPNESETFFHAINRYKEYRPEGRVYPIFEFYLEKIVSNLFESTANVETIYPGLKTLDFLRN